MLIAIDGSSIGRGCACLMASVIYRGRALPLVWAVREGKKGQFSAADHLVLLERVGQIVPDGAEMIVLGDGEFDSVDLQQTLNGAG